MGTRYHHRHWRPWAAGLVVGLAATAAAAADQELVVPASQDTSIFDGTPGSATLADGSGDFLWLSVTAEGQVRRLLVKFDLSSIPTSAVVKSVSLSLYESRSRADHPVAVHRLTAAWGEGTSNAGGAGNGAPAAPGDATWVSRFHPSIPWTTPGGDRDAVASATVLVGSPNQAYTWSGTRPGTGQPVPKIVQDVQDWVAQPGSNHGWILIGDEVVQQNAKRFESRNNGSVGPTLRVVFEPAAPVPTDADVPLPPWALGLLGAMLLGVALRSRAGGMR